VLLLSGEKGPRKKGDQDRTRRRCPVDSSRKSLFYLKQTSPRGGGDRKDLGGEKALDGDREKTMILSTSEKKCRRNLGLRGKKLLIREKRINRKDKEKKPEFAREKSVGYERRGARKWRQ